MRGGPLDGASSFSCPLQPGFHSWKSWPVPSSHVECKLKLNSVHSFLCNLDR